MGTAVDVIDSEATHALRTPRLAVVSLRRQGVVDAPQHSARGLKAGSSIASHPTVLATLAMAVQGRASPTKALMSGPKAAASGCYPNHPGPPRCFALQAVFGSCAAIRLGAEIKTRVPRGRIT